MNITRNILHDWYRSKGARTVADVQRLAASEFGLKLTADKVVKILHDQIPRERWYQTRIIAAVKQIFPGSFVRKMSAGVYSESGFPDVLVIYDGRYIGLEVKRPFLGAPSPLQISTIKEIQKAGGVAAIVRMPEEAVDLVNFAMEDIQ
jgi:hypothetical protein